MPKISVIMGVYNDEKYLSDAIDSILNQSYKDLEFIICDDGSTDNSVNIIKKYQKVDKRILFLQNKKNMGLAASLNKCIEISTGEYIARMDSDDVSLPERFEKQVEYLDNNKHIALIGCNVNLFDDNGNYGKREVNREYTKVNVFKKNYFIHPTVMIRRNVLLSVGGYTVSNYTYRTEDYDLWCKICEKDFLGYNLNETLLNYREDKNAYKKRKFKYRIDAIKLRRIWFKNLNISLKYFPYVYRPLVVGLIPTFIMRRYKRQKFKI